MTVITGINYILNCIKIETPTMQEACGRELIISQTLNETKLPL